MQPATTLNDRRRQGLHDLVQMLAELLVDEVLAEDNAQRGDHTHASSPVRALQHRQAARDLD